MGIGRVGGGGRSDFEYDHPEVLEGGGAVSEAAESEAAAIAAGAGPLRTSIRWFDFKDFEGPENLTFLRDGGSALFEGKSLGQDLRFRFDGAIVRLQAHIEAMKAQA